MSDINVTIKLDEIKLILQRRGLESQGAVQVYIDNEVIKQCDPYVPFDTGMLKHSAILATVIGKGEVVYNTPYAKKQYHGNFGKGLRGKLWFDRMKADHLGDILNGAAKVAGGKPS